MSDVETLKQLEEGDKILFEGRKIPLEITGEKGEHTYDVKGPQGGEYILFKAENQEKLLVAPKGRRSYASYIEDLRKVGRWIREEDIWRHSKTGKKVSLEKNEIGRWTIETDLKTGFEPPKYGYSDKESALEDAEDIVKENPEGE